MNSPDFSALLAQAQSTMQTLFSAAAQAAPTSGVKANLDAAAAAWLAQLGAVSRAEYETQQALLLKLRAQVEALEQQLQAKDKV